jgi:hypothetical protein
MDLEKNLFNHYLLEFNREYLSTAADRREFGETLVNGALTVALIIATAVVLLMV